jgi:hypothetical protein
VQIERDGVMIRVPFKQTPALLLPALLYVAVHTKPAHLTLLMPFTFRRQNGIA